MPGPLIHMSNARHVAQQLKDSGYVPKPGAGIDPTWSGHDIAQLGRYMTDHPNFTALGAVGPDLFFFLPDFRDFTPIPGLPAFPTSSVLASVLQFLEDVYTAVDPYISKWEHYLGPISEDTAEEMSRLTGGLSEAVGDITGELRDILIGAVENFAVKHVDLLGFFSLGLDHGWDDKAYFWSDMLHYRRTADFGRALWNRANIQEDGQLCAYALGYLTHVAADTTGHPYVNAVTGGPYRTHWTRHHLTENHLDALWYVTDPDTAAPNKVPGYAQLTESALYFDIAFSEDDVHAPVSRPAFPDGNTLRDNWTRKRLLDVDSALPDSVAQLLLDAINDIFYADGVLHPLILKPDGKPDKEMLKNMYDLFFRLQKLMTVDGFNHEPPEPPDLFPNLDFPTFTDPAGDDAPGSSDGDSDGGSFWDLLLSVIAILAYIVEVAIYLATLPWAVLTDVATYPLRLGLYYALELPLFHLLKNFRAVMVMMGYFLPMADEISPSMTRIGATAQMNFDQVLAEMGDVFGGMIDVANDPGTEQSFRDIAYPYQLLNPQDPQEYRHPWNYPDRNAYPDPNNPTETPATTASPYASGAGPSVLFADRDPDPDIRYRLESAQDPCSANEVGLDVAPERNLGSCVGFSKYTIWLATRESEQGGEGESATVQMTNWNLDADRGYGYHCWDFNRKAAIQANPLQDPDGKLYQPPCVWPPQVDSDAGQYQPGVQQKVHWVDPGMDDPGCGAPDCSESGPGPGPD